MSNGRVGAARLRPSGHRLPLRPGTTPGPIWAGRASRSAALPVIIFFATLVSILYYLRIMQFLVIKWIGGAIQKVTGITKVESAWCRGEHLRRPVRKPAGDPAIPCRPHPVAVVHGDERSAWQASAGNDPGRLRRDEAIYIQYLLAASFMSAPGGILMAKIMMPDEPASEPDLRHRTRRPSPRQAIDEEKPASTSSWPRRWARRPASKSRLRSARW
ncbi:CNT family concentrative nucleoside transporter [Aphelenchoides bicaudatus]|nr:CNT family concentrative nucleoside transporter [Aphelenchoides bicaudatus]